MPKRICVSGNRLTFAGKDYRCAIGKSGIILAAAKQEGDGGTPIGIYPLRECWYRPDHVNTPITHLPLRIITPEDKWCDDPKHPWYNRHFIFPSSCRENMPTSYESLWREDYAYNVIVPLGYNDDPVIPGKGSAIFLHVAKPDYTPTEGCVALALADLLELLPMLDASAILEVKN